MSTNQPSHALAIEHMLASNALVIDQKMFLVKGSKSLTPIGVFTQPMLRNDDLMHFIVKTMVHYIPGYVTHVAGFGNDGAVLAYLVAKASGRIPLPLQNDEHGNIAGFQFGKPLYGANVLLIPSIIATGKNSAKDILSIEAAGGHCTNIFPVFDYGFYLTSKVASHTHIDALLTTESVEQYIVQKDACNELVTSWKETEHNLFRAESWILGQREITQPKKKEPTEELAV